MKKALSQVSRPQVFQPKKYLGQHFLRSKSVLAKIIEAADLKTSDLVLEIGPGLGVLTEKLAEKAGRVVAVEKDSRLIPLLKEKFAKTSNVEIIQGDILRLVSSIEYLVSSMKNLRSSSNTRYNPSTNSGLSRVKSRDKIPNTKYKVVANLPYYAATHIIRQFLESPCPPKLMVLMLQKEVAQRICAKPPKMSLLAVSVQFYAKAQIISYVSKDAFWPRPKVDSAIIKIKPLINADRKLINADLFFKIVKAGFSQPRKTLINNLSRQLKLPKEKVGNWLSAVKINSNRRPAELELDDWLNLVGHTMSNKIK